MKIEILPVDLDHLSHSAANNFAAEQPDRFSPISNLSGHDPEGTNEGCFLWTERYLEAAILARALDGSIWSDEAEGGDYAVYLPWATIDMSRSLYSHYEVRETYK